MDLDTRAALIAEMLAGASMTAADVDERFARAQDADHWRRLCPELSVDSPPGVGMTDLRSMTDAEVTRTGDAFRADGYLHVETLVPAALVGRMRDGVERLRAAGWPPVFTFVYDEFWSVFRTPSIARLLTAAIGREYRQNSVLWTYYVAARDGASGWTPHAEGNGDDRITIWIPLTDATTDNGCMYVIPRGEVPASLSVSYRQWTSLDRAQLERLLQGTRALPARAGSVLGWSHDVVHWGSIAKHGATPRISIALEFIAASAKAIGWEQPVLACDRLPSIPERLYAIGKCLAQYRKFEPMMARYGELASRLKAATATAAGIQR